jgi:HAD superfamily hydrolase (TIGR01484 family)
VIDQLCRPISQFPDDRAHALRFFLFDIDDTLSHEGLIPAASYWALWELHRAGIQLVAVTGRPAGWCDHIARMWPVAGIVGENGAFYFSYDREAKRMNRVHLQDEATRHEGTERLEELKRRVVEEVPGSAIAADQAFRLSDVAVDFREDVEPLGPEAVERIGEIASELGLTYRVSSIHVNCWYGSYSKIDCARRLLSDLFSFEMPPGPTGRYDGTGVCYIGDSPNDEPLFAALGDSIGVANIRDFLDRLEHRPRYLTVGESSNGFVEAADTILRKRSLKLSPF